MKVRTPESVLRPGPDGWELWKFPQKGGPVMEASPPLKSVASAQQLLLALPTRDVLAVPLWVSAEGDSRELAELELSGRHLLRRGAPVYTLPIEQRDGRALVLALSAGDESDAAEFFPRARSFDVPARLWDPGEADALVWREPGGLCFAFFRDRRCVYFAATGESSPGPAFCGVLTRAALGLRAEDVIARMPASLRLIGSFTEEERTSLANGLRVDLDHIPSPPPPVLPSVPAHVAPPSARLAQEKRSTRRRLAILGGLGLAVYALVLAVLGANMLLQEMELRAVTHEAAMEAPAAGAAKELVGEWKEFSGAIDPRMFALDQLAAVAAEIPGDKVRLTQFTLEGGRLLIAGEAADVSQAFEFFERVKKKPALQDYDWTSRQPQLAGKTKVRFEMEGARPDAKTGDE